MDSEIRYHKLSNGLQLIGECTSSRKSAAVGFFVKTGSRDEVPVESGVSHFLEHMMFKGTEKRSALDITFALGNIGAQANAFTSEENTVYYAAVVPEYFKDMQELLSDMLRPSLDINEFTTEKKVILEEIALYQDRPQFYLFEHSMRDYFGSHPAGNSVLGSQESISKLERDQMKSYFDRRYAPNNIALIAAGNFDWNSFVADAEKFCGNWKNFETPRNVKAHPATAIQKEYKKKNITQAHVLLMTEGASAQEEERYAVSVLALMVGDSSGSKLYWELIDPGIAESAGADNDERDGTGVFMAYASVEPKQLDRVSQILKSVVNKAYDFTDAEFEQAKTKLCSRIVLSGELPMGRLMAMGLEWHYRHKIDSLRSIVQRIRSLTRADLVSASKRFPFNKWSEFRLVPE